MPESPFESPKSERQTALAALDSICTSVEADRFVENAYRLSFESSDATVTIRIIIDDEQSGADVAITNMTTLPEEQIGKGYGSEAIQSLIDWATVQGMTNIQAVQIMPHNEEFWTNRGFKKMNNETNDFLYIK